MKKTMTKRLCRIRLINWHYFVDETINIQGSSLVTGENTSGKSTILDAIQFVLTTNHRKFNIAANEKSKRDLKGYVRCKTGNEDSAYIRKGNVISYVALEFFEEKTSKYFILGAKVASPDEESRPTVRWFREECRLEDLSFITKDSPSTDEEFRKGSKRVYLIKQISEAKARFAQRLGNLDDRFFDMIPKSLAFKPIDRVKDFITNFILPEKNIEVGNLRTNIETLKELENLMNTTKQKIDFLAQILEKNEEIRKKDRDIKVNAILISKAQLEAYKENIKKAKIEIESNKKKLINEQNRERVLNEEVEKERTRKSSLEVALANNETTKLITETKHNIEMINKDISHKKESINKLKATLNNLTSALLALSETGVVFIPKEKVTELALAEGDIDEKNETLLKLKGEFRNLLDKYRSDKIKLEDNLNRLTDRKASLEEEIINLKNKRLTYPINTVRLKAAIEKEFSYQEIKSDVRIFSDLLEITDHSWHDAVEGYLNTQRFYILVEPRYYKTALDVYYKIKKEVHTVGLINTEKLDTNRTADTDSLAYVVKSDNRWAKAYANFLLNRVKRCDDVHSLKDHKTAITKDCMLYTNFAVRKIDSEIYKTPYIGAHAFKVQLENKTKELEEVNSQIKNDRLSLSNTKDMIGKLDVRFETIEENLYSPYELDSLLKSLSKENEELKKAEQDTGYIEIKLQIDECDKRIKKIEKDTKGCLSNIFNIETLIRNAEQGIEENGRNVKMQEEVLISLTSEDGIAAREGLIKYEEQIRTKSNTVIVNNFTRSTTGLENAKKQLIEDLIKMQSRYASIYQIDFGVGVEQIEEYINEHHKLVSSDIIKYEEDLKRAKENCELEFRENFLARLRENIENAKIEFKNLNDSLKDIYYGEDSYRFFLSAAKAKESIYKMIMSEKNNPGFNLWSNSFEEEYKEEMDDLFTKLTAYDDLGEKVIAEYTDYRNYLDYDIEVVKKDGSKQKFSKIYGEKSGGETQTPYYVAIAASFAQLYRHGDTTRIIMFDEAFDKMDDGRIKSMMDFLNSQGFQIILATPTSKMEVIGEKVDTILLVIRDGKYSFVQEYDL